LLLSVMASVFGLAPAQAASSTYTTGFTRWRAADGGFAGWTREGILVGNGGTLTLDPDIAATGSDPYPAGGYNGGNFYNGGSFVVGEAVSPKMTTKAFTEAIASWNAHTPQGTWIETLIRADIAGRWTKWYNLGVWASETGIVDRHYVNALGDADGFVAVDTLVLNGKKAPPATGFQLKVRLFQADRGSAVPTVHAMSVATSTTASKPSTLVPGSPTLWNTLLDVPECSQMVYPDGGEVWCSPTSVSMVLGYWQGGGEDAASCEARVRAAVEGVYDWLYDGHGNWPFNTAYAAEQGYEAYVARFTSMAQAEEWIAAGVPVVISFAWKKSDLTGAAIPSSAGHLAVLVGFDGKGNPIVNDPAHESNEGVRRTYNRAELESLWLEHSGGTVYLIYPEGHPVPTILS